MDNNFKVLGNRVIVKEFIPEKKTKDGIIIPDLVKDKHEPKMAVVIAVGDKVNENIKKGSTVILDRNTSAYKITIEGEDFTIVYDTEIAIVYNN